MVTKYIIMVTITTLATNTTGLSEFSSSKNSQLHVYYGSYTEVHIIKPLHQLAGDLAYTKPAD